MHKPEQELIKHITQIAERSNLSLVNHRALDVGWNTQPGKIVAYFEGSPISANSATLLVSQLDGVLKQADPSRRYFLTDQEGTWSYHHVFIGSSTYVLVDCGLGEPENGDGNDTVTYLIVTQRTIEEPSFWEALIRKLTW